MTYRFQHPRWITLIRFSAKEDIYELLYRLDDFAFALHIWELLRSIIGPEISYHDRDISWFPHTPHKIHGYYPKIGHSSFLLSTALQLAIRLLNTGYETRDQELVLVFKQHIYSHSRKTEGAIVCYIKWSEKMQFLSA
jgi:hypothetical protein